MKKIKLLMPTLGLAAVAGIVPTIASCGNKSKPVVVTEYTMEIGSVPGEYKYEADAALPSGKYRFKTPSSAMGAKYFLFKNSDESLVEIDANFAKGMVIQYENGEENWTTLNYGRDYIAENGQIEIKNAFVTAGRMTFTCTLSGARANVVKSVHLAS